MSGTYYVLQCPSCGRWGVKNLVVGVIKGVFRCKSEGCRKTSKMKQHGVYGIALNYEGPYTNPNDASNVCQGKGRPE